jgi:peptidoglycan hydrolase CwlO-like protein
MKSKTGNVLLVISFIVLLYFVIFKNEDLKAIKYKHVEVSVDSTYKIDTAADIAFKKLNDVDSILKSDKIKQERLLNETRRIKDSISTILSQIKDMKRKVETEKLNMKNKYEKHIDEIYKVNCIQRGGPEDTVKY